MCHIVTLWREREREKEREREREGIEEKRGERGEIERREMGSDY